MDLTATNRKGKKDMQTTINARKTLAITS